MKNLTKISIPLAIVVAGLIIGGAFVYINQNKVEKPAGTKLSAQEVADKALNYINQHKDELAGGSTASLIEIIDVGEIYKIRLKIGEIEYNSYTTKDGRFLFPGGYDLEETTSTSTPANLDNFAKCLTEKGVKFYGASWCGHCANQKEMFGDSMKFVNYIECWDDEANKMNAVCEEAGIEGFPTWEFADGTRQSGEMSLEKLSEMSGCLLE